MNSAFSYSISSTPNPLLAYRDATIDITIIPNTDKPVVCHLLQISMPRGVRPPDLLAPWESLRTPESTKDIPTPFRVTARGYELDCGDAGYQIGPDGITLRIPATSISPRGGKAYIDVTETTVSNPTAVTTVLTILKHPAPPLDHNPVWSAAPPITGPSGGSTFDSSDPSRWTPLSAVDTAQEFRLVWPIRDPDTKYTIRYVPSSSGSFDSSHTESAEAKVWPPSGPPAYGYATIKRLERDTTFLLYATSSDPAGASRVLGCTTVTVKAPTIHDLKVTGEVRLTAQKSQVFSSLELRDRIDIKSAFDCEDLVIDKNTNLQLRPTEKSKIYLIPRKDAYVKSQVVEDILPVAYGKVPQERHAGLMHINTEAELSVNFGSKPFSLTFDTHMAQNAIYATFPLGANGDVKVTGKVRAFKDDENLYTIEAFTPTDTGYRVEKVKGRDGKLKNPDITILIEFYTSSDSRSAEYTWTQ